MNNKLSELSKPVATVDVQRGRMDGNTFAVAWSSAGHAMPDGPHFIYSQEYVSALIQRAERIDSMLTESVQALKVEEQRISELEEDRRQLNLIINSEANRADAAEKRAAELSELETQVKVWESAATKHLARAEEAEKRLATPVRLPETYSPEPWMGPDPSGTWLDKEDVKKSIRTAGFTVEGDE